MTSTSTRHARRGRLVAGALIGLAAAMAALAADASGLLHDLELITYDWRMRVTARAAEPSDAIVIVAIDDDSVRRMAPLVGRWPWPRLVHGQLVDYLSRGPARVIAYDVLFTEPDVRRFDVGDEEWTGAQSDAAFADSIAKAGTVVLAADAAAEPLLDASRALPDVRPAHPRRDLPPGACVEERGLIVPPLSPLDAAARGVGHTLFLRDADGPLRRYHPFVRYKDVVLPSFALAVAEAAGARALPGGACPPLIPYRGPTLDAANRATFRSYSFYDLFYSEEQILAGEPPQVDPAVFKGKIVVVSATASGTDEVQASPFAQGISGGEVHANIVDALIGGRSIEPGGRALAFGSTVLLAVAVGTIGAFLSIAPLTAVAGALAAAFTWGTVRAFASGVWLPLAAPLLAVAAAFVGQLAWQYFVEGREKRDVKRVFSRYVPKDVFDQLMDDPARASLGGTRRTMTVLFSDVRGFTALSERLTPEEVVEQLNQYFSIMVDVLFAHRGTLDKFVGDMVMGLFGAPLDDPDHADHAVQAARAMAQALDSLNREWTAAGRPPLDIGVGISTGEMVAGNIGSNTIMSYTVIGDTVNLGARLESLNKELGTRIIISEATRRALKGQYDIRPLGEVFVKGKSRPVGIYEVK